MKKILLTLLFNFLIFNQSIAQNSNNKNFSRFNFENLPNEKRELVKKENERHRQEVKNITGVELPIGENDVKLSPQEREEIMKKNSKTFESLTLEKKELLKIEMERHFQEIKNITGFDIINKNSPQNFNQNNQKRCKEPSQEERENHRKIIENLSADKKILVKNEMERHFQEMKKITGAELPKPKCDQ